MHLGDVGGSLVELLLNVQLVSRNVALLAVLLLLMTGLQQQAAPLSPSTK